MSPTTKKRNPVIHRPWLILAVRALGMLYATVATVPGPSRPSPRHRSAETGRGRLWPDIDSQQADVPRSPGGRITPSWRRARCPVVA